MKAASAALIVLFLIVIAPAPTFASPESRKLIDEGRAELSRQNFTAALEKFTAAGEADPTDGDALFFQGAALNRLGRHADALARLQNGQALGSAHPDLPFELGWSLVALGRLRAAIPYLERYEQARPGRGQTSEFLGRAYLGAGELDKAEAKLKEAIQRDPALKPTALSYLAALEQRRGSPAGAKRWLDELLREAPDTPLAKLLREQMAVAAPPEAKPWNITLSAGGGRNSNVIVLGDHRARPVDVSHKNSGFGRLSLGGTYDWRITGADTFTVGYGLLAHLYSRLPSFNEVDHFGIANYRHLFSRDLAGELRMTNQFAEVKGHNFSNQWALRPSLAYRFTDWAAAEAAYSAGVNKSYFSAVRASGRKSRNRDSSTHTISLTPAFEIPGTDFTARGGYFHTWNFADGSDYDYRSNGLVVALSHPLIWQVDAELAYIGSFDRYDHHNSFAEFLVKRRDDVHVIRVELTRPLNIWLNAYVRLDYTNNQSNVMIFNYKQDILGVGLIARF